MSRRRRIPEETENTDRWLISYADFITLLFAFFVVMYSMSSVNLGKYRVLSDSMTTAFSQKTRPSTASSSNQPLGVSVQRAPISIGVEGQSGFRAMRETAEKIEARMKSWIKKGKIAVRGNEKWLEVEINSSILYTSGSATLSQQASQILTSLTEVFEDSRNPLYVSGYTDNLPIRTVKYPSNWELSSARAASVVRLMASNGIDPSRMGAIGFGEFRPVADNSSAENRQKNRRVVIRIMSGDDLFSESTPFEDSATETKPPIDKAQGLPVRSLQPGEPARALQ
ncbi:MAG: flagellar motor protein MotD [Gammaproteobacteria bacterium]